MITSLNRLSIGKAAIISPLIVVLAVLGTIDKKFFIIFFLSIISLLLVLNNKFYRFSLFTTIYLYIVINLGITNLGVNLGGFLIPIAEGIIVFGIIRIIIFKFKFKFNTQNSYFNIFSLFAVFFMFFILRAPFNILEYGQIALRDGTHYIELFYFFIVLNELNIMKNQNLETEKFIRRFLIFTFNTVFIYSLFYFNPSFLTNISPVYYGYQKTFNLIGNFNSTHIWLLMLIVINVFLVDSKKNYLSLLIHLQNIICILIILVTTSRVTIITYFIIFLYLLLAGKYKKSMYLLNYLLILLFLLCFLLFFDIKISGRRGIIDFIFIKNMFLSIIGSGNIESMSGGVSQRKLWIKDVLMQSLNIKDFFVGRGFGVALINFYDEQGVLVREPHNSLLSIFARTGIVSLVIWLSAIFKLFRIGFSERGHNIWGFLINILILIALINCIVEPFFELPYTAVPFYSLLAIFTHLIIVKRNI